MATPTTHSSATKPSTNGGTTTTTETKPKERRPMTVRIAMKLIMRALDALPSDADRARVLASVAPLYQAPAPTPTSTTPGAQ